MTEAHEVSVQKRHHRHRVMLVIVTAICTVFYTGAPFGWGPMQLMLEENEAFQNLCKEGEETPCPDQTSLLLNIQLVAQLTLIFAPLAGFVGDKYGAFKLMSIAAVCSTTGLTFLTIAAATNIDNLLWAAFALIGLTTVTSNIVMMQAGTLFEGIVRQRVISALNGLFDTGALVYLGLWAIQNATGVTLATLSAVYLGGAVVVFGVALYLWYVVVPVRDDASAIMQVEPLPDSTEALDKNIVDPTTRTEEECDGEADASAKSMPIPIGEIATQSAEVPERSAIQDDVAASIAETSICASEDYVPIHKRKSAQQLRSKQFVLLVVFFSFLGASNIFTLTSARAFLGYLGDDEYGNRYLAIFTLMTPVSLLALPFLDIILNRYGYYVGLQSINVLALIHGIIKCASTNLNVQIFGFIVFSFFRSFMFSISFAFLPTFVSTKVVGKGSGLMVLSQGMVSFINIPLATLAVKQFDGDFFWPNLFYTIGVLPCIYLAWLMGRGIQKESEATERLLAVSDVSRNTTRDSQQTATLVAEDV